jgi:hypothetical protein
MTDVQLFFVEYLFILENEVRQFQIELLRNKYAKYILCYAHVIITQWSSIFNNFNKYQ